VKGAACKQDQLTTRDKRREEKRSASPQRSWAITSRQANVYCVKD